MDEFGESADAGRADQLRVADHAPLEKRGYPARCQLESPTIPVQIPNNGGFSQCQLLRKNDWRRRAWPAHGPHRSIVALHEGSPEEAELAAGRCDRGVRHRALAARESGRRKGELGGSTAGWTTE